MIVVTTGDSYDDDIFMNLYYCKAEKIKRPCEYIGLYKDKSIRAIGKIKKVIETFKINDKLNTSLVYGEPIIDKDKEKILESIEKAKILFNCDIGSIKHKYFIVENFIETDYKKVSKGGLMGNKYFNLNQILKVNKLPPTEEIANKLKDESWN